MEGHAALPAAAAAEGFFTGLLVDLVNLDFDFDLECDAGAAAAAAADDPAAADDAVKVELLCRFAVAAMAASGSAFTLVASCLRFFELELDLLCCCGCEGDAAAAAVAEAGKACDGLAAAAKLA